MTKDESIIPKGVYCYIPDCLHPNINWEDFFGFQTLNCPYDGYKTINGARVAWCNFLEKGGWINGEEDKNPGTFQKLVEHFGSEDKVWDNLTLDLLWDSCKECGVKHDEDFETKEEIQEWYDKVRKFKNENNLE